LILNDKTLVKQKSSYYFTMAHLINNNFLSKSQEFALLAAAISVWTSPLCDHKSEDPWCS